MFDRLDERVNADAVLERRSKFLDLAFGLAVGEDRRVIAVRHGRIAAPVPAGTGAPEPAFSITVDPAAWAEFCKPMPKPGHHHVMAMVENGHARVEGAMLPYFTNLYFIMGVLDHARRASA